MNPLILVASFLIFLSCGKSHQLPKVEINSSMGKIVVAIDTIHAPTFLLHVHFIRKNLNGTYSGLLTIL